MKKVNCIYQLFYWLLPLSILCEYLKARNFVQYDPFYAVFKIVLLVIGIICYKEAKISIKKSVLFFAGYICASGISYFFNNKSVSCYYDSLMSFVLPMMMTFVGMNEKIDSSKFIRFYSIKFGVMVLITIYPFVSLSPWYISFINSTRDVSDAQYGADFWADKLRFSGVYGSPYYIMYPGIPLLAFLCKNIKKGCGLPIDYLLAIIITIGLFLTQQRTALFFVIVVLLFYLPFRYKVLVPIISFLAGSIFLYFTDNSDLIYRFSELLDIVIDRFNSMTFSSAFGERQEKVFRVFPIWQNIVFGDGVGVYGHVAHSLGYVSVNDCGWIKLLVENGIVGLILFMRLIYKTLKRGFKFINESDVEFIIIVFYIVAMSGSNSLSMEYTLSLFFWLSIGRIWKVKFIN